MSVDLVMRGFVEKIAGPLVRYDPFINLGREVVQKYTKNRMIVPVLTHTMAGAAIGGIGGVIGTAAIQNKEDVEGFKLKHLIPGVLAGALAGGGLKYYRNLARKNELAGIKNVIRNPKTKFINEASPYNIARDKAVRDYAMKDTRHYGGGYTGQDLYKDHERRLRSIIDIDRLFGGSPKTNLRNKYVTEVHQKFQQGFQPASLSAAGKGDAADRLLDRLKNLSPNQQAKYLHPDALIKRRDIPPAAKRLADDAFKRIHRATTGTGLHPLEEAGRQYRTTLEGRRDKLRKGMRGIL